MSLLLAHRLAGRLATSSSVRLQWHQAQHRARHVGLELRLGGNARHLRSIATAAATVELKRAPDGFADLTSKTLQGEQQPPPGQGGPEGPESQQQQQGFSAAEADGALFELDPSVPKWSNAERPFSSQRGELQDVLRAITTAATSGDTQTAAFWAYHMARFSYFVSQAASGLIAHAVSETVGLGASTSSSGQQGGSSKPAELPAERLLKSAGPELTARMWEAYGTWVQDYANIQARVYKLPWDMMTPNKQFNPAYVASRSLRFLFEGAATLRRRVRGAAEPVWLKNASYPQYYTNTYHYQSDGWLSDWSASIYEHSTETLFQGRQDAMQRSALVPLSSFIKSSSTPPSEMRLLEVAAGTGRFHTFIKDNWPDIPSVVSDLSPFYLQRARNNIKEWKRLRQPNKSLGGTDGAGVEYMQMAAEKLDVPDHSFDMVVCVYLFHELPEPVRRKAVAEWFRVLKPGGLCVLTDSTQLGDRPEWDKGIQKFGDFNEPFYVNYVSCDLGAMFTDAGFVPGTKYLISATKTLSFTKPLAA